MGYSHQAISGFSYQTLLKITAAAVAVVKMAVLARLLGPEAYGIFSLSTIALGLSEASTETGVNITMVRSEKTVKYFLDSAWVISICRAFVVGTVMLVLGFLLTNFFHQPDLLWLVALLSLVPVIRGFINPAIVGWQKELNFAADSWYRLALILAEAIFALTLAFIMHSVYALPWAMILTALLEVAISFIFVKNKPHFAYSRSRGAEIFSNSKALSVATFFNYLSENLDNLLIGKINGVYNLGLYDRSYALAHKLNYEFAKSAYHSLFPTFSKFNKDSRRLKRAFKKSVLVLMTLFIVFSLPVLVKPEFFVKIILGEKWLAVAAFLPWLILAGLVQSLSSLFYSLLLAQKKFTETNLHLFVSIALMVILIIFLGQQYGIVGAAAAVFLARLLATPILFWAYRH